MKIINIYDNLEFDSRYKTGHGFASLIQNRNKTMLFDTGGDSPTLLLNLNKTGIKPEQIDVIFLSHVHNDHTGGLLGFLEKDSHVKIYLPISFPSSLKKDISSLGAEVIEINASVQIKENFYTTGELGIIKKEQSLIIDSEKGLIIITGCAHPRIVEIAKKARELLNKNIYFVMGGFHLCHDNNSQIEGIINSFKKLEVKKIAPSHCTGEKARNLFKEEYGDNFIENGVGKMIEIN
jgi:7,8-dihydropterin-6-yl-methyl-4-(beta-D-ribofuranosyl)aminobenzene 5'-phosphate synthase